jgi:hypothetical protein
MSLPKVQWRACVSVVLAVSMAMVFSLSSLAGETVPVRFQPTVQPPQNLSGLLNGRGDITINGNRASSGATVLTGNKVAIGAHGNATIELGALGRIELKSNTAITAILSPGTVPLSLDLCGSVTQTLPPGVAAVLTDPNHDRAHVKVFSGQVHVRYDNGKEQDLKTGDSKTFDSLDQVTSPGGTVFRVSCHDHFPYYLLGLGALALLGTALGLVESGGDHVVSGPTLSPAQP